MTPRQRELDRLARADHEKNCRNEPRYDSISVSHAWVHEANALHEYARQRPRRPGQSRLTEGSDRT